MLLSLSFLMACGNSEKEEKQQITIGTQTSRQAPAAQTKSTRDIVDLSNKGIGPITSITLSDEIDSKLAEKGKIVFDNMCIACHKVDRRFIGPQVKGVTKLRAPEWIMNMIMNPEEMIQKDPIAKQMLVEFNMAVMANQNISESDARAILEYFRQIDQD